MTGKSVQLKNENETVQHIPDFGLGDFSPFQSDADIKDDDYIVETKGYNRFEYHQFLQYFMP